MTISKNICACPAISGPKNVCIGTPATYTFDSYNLGPVTKWQVQPAHLFAITSSNTTTATITTTAINGEMGTIIAETNNGAKAYTKNIWASCAKGSGGNPGSYVSIYPNPTDGLLYIEIDADAALALLPSAVKSSLTFDVRLYDGQGNLLRQQKTQGGTVQFNVSDLINGVYFLHVYDGVNQSPVMEQIVIEH